MITTIWQHCVTQGETTEQQRLRAPGGGPARKVPEARDRLSTTADSQWQAALPDGLDQSLFTSYRRSE
jgi:hypothetical protein